MEWRRIYNSKYDASSDGQIRNSLTNRILKGGIASNGYRTVCLSVEFKMPKTHTVHSLIALAFYGPRPEGKEVCHINGNGLDNRAENLYYGTRSENMQDAVRHGTQVPGGQHEFCAKGLHLMAESARISSDGRRRCRICTNQWKRQNRKDR